MTVGIFHRVSILSCCLLAACSREPSAQYIGQVTSIKNRIDDLINDDPRQPHAYVEAAHFLIFVEASKGWPGKSGKPMEIAEAMLTQAEQKNPEYCDIYWLRAQLHFVQKMNDRVLDDAVAAARYQCDDPWLHVARGGALAAMERIDEAGTEFRKVVDAGPGPTSHSKSSFASAAFDYGGLLYRTGEHDRLRDVMSQWEAAGLVFDPWGQINLAYLFNLIGEFDRARVAAQSALAVVNLPAARNAYGLSLYGKAWSLEVAHGKSADSEQLIAQARTYLTDEKIALNIFWGEACCVSEAWVKVLRQHAAAYPDLHL